MKILTFYGGVGEVGGNKILVDSGKTKIFLDFGMSFTQFGKYFDEFLQPRKCSGIGDFIEMGLLPDLKGLYRKDYLEKMKLKPGKRGYDAVLLNHAHADHSAYIHFLREDIPVKCSLGTARILQALEDTGSTGFLDFLNLKECFKFRPSKRNPDKMTKITGEACKIPRTFDVFKSSKIEIGDLKIEIVPTDHSLVGSTAFLIEAKDKRIVYTGDFRFHGYRAEDTKRFVKKAADFKPDVLICEGTRIDENKGYTEDEVKGKIKKVVSETKKLVLCNFPVRDTDRLKTFYSAAKENGRSLVINMKQAYLLKLLEDFDVPGIDDKFIRIFIPYKTWGVFKDHRYPKEIQEGDYESWEKPFLEHKNHVTADDIKGNEKDFVFRCDFFELKNLIDIKPSAGSVYIRSICEPFTEEMFIDERRVENWLKHFGLFPPFQAHASGHASGFEIAQMIRQIKPKKVIPVHTDKPELFKEMGVEG